MKQEQGRPVKQPKIALLAGKGDRSGVPRYLQHLTSALEGSADLTVIADVNRGGYDFVSRSKTSMIEINGLATGFQPLVVFCALRKLFKMLRSCHFDIVSAHTRPSILVVRLFLIGQALLGKNLPKTIVTYHGLPFAAGQRPVVRMISRALEWIIVRASPPHCLVFLTDAAQREFVTKTGRVACRKHTLLTQANCSNLGQLPVPCKRPANRTIVMTSRAGHQKNLAAAIALFSRLPDDYRLVLCGPETDSPAFRAKAERMTSKLVAARISFAGPVDDIRPFLANADLYMLTSRYEGLSIGAIEAFEAGLPVALSDIPGNAEILAAHPFSLPLTLKDLASDAKALHHLIETYLSDRAIHKSRIHRVWRKNYSFDHWKRGAQTLYLAKPTRTPESNRSPHRLKDHFDKSTTGEIGAKRW